MKSFRLKTYASEWFLEGPDYLTKEGFGAICSSLLPEAMDIAFAEATGKAISWSNIMQSLYECLLRNGFNECEIPTHTEFPSGYKRILEHNTASGVWANVTDS